jgi:uncharacterized membrane protein YqgA involved in biofilm formation
MRIGLGGLLRVILRLEKGLRGGLELLIVFLSDIYNIIFCSVVGVVVCVVGSSIISSSISIYLVVVVINSSVDNNNIYNINNVDDVFVVL